MPTLIFNAVTNAENVKQFYKTTGKKLNVLISYPYLKGQATKLVFDCKEMRGLLYLDSGAFSGKGKVNLVELGLFLKRWGDSFDAYFNLDNDFGDPDHNFENQMYLEKCLTNLKKKPIPVIHDKDSPVGEIEKYYGLGHRYIAIGSAGKNLTGEENAKIKNMEGLRIHMFGDLSRKMLSDFAPYSADSSSFLQEARHGSIYYWDPEVEKEYLVYLGGRERDKKEQKKGSKSVDIDSFDRDDELMAFLDGVFEYDVADIIHNEDKRRIVNLYFMWQLENEILSAATPDKEKNSETGKE